MKLLIKKLHPDAIIPKYQTKGSAVFDLHAVCKVNYENSYNWDSGDFHTGDADPCHIIMQPNSQFVVRTGLSVAVPDGYEMQIRPRSGLSFKHRITITNSPGTLDQDFRGEIMVILYNLGSEEFRIDHEDRIAQAIINKIEQVEMVEVKEFDKEIMDKDRGGGFGSTGK